MKTAKERQKTKRRKGVSPWVLKWIVGLGDRFHAAHVTAHAVGEIGFSSHGWRLAKKGAAAA